MRTRDFSAPALERLYDNRAAVPEHPRHFERWAREAAAARESLSCRLDVRFGAGPKATLDLFPAAGGRGLLAFLHGGYWRAFDKSDFSWIAPPLVGRGVSVAMVNYDLCPAVTLDTIVAQCRDALEWLCANAEANGCGGARIAVAGHSAGGHLAAMMLSPEVAMSEACARRLAGALSVSGLFELAPLRSTALNADLRLDPPACARLSPARHRPARVRPLVLAVGADETPEFVRQNRLLWEAWPECRPEGEPGPLELPGRNHFSAVEALAEPDAPLLPRALALLD